MNEIGSIARGKKTLVIPLLLLLMAVQSHALSVGQASVASQEKAASSMKAADILTGPEARGDLMMSQKRYQAAIREFAGAPQDSAVVLNKTGVAYHYMSNLQAAKSYYQRALQINSRYAEAMNNLAAVFYAEKKYHASEKLYKKGLKISPRNASLYSNLGTLYFAEGSEVKGADAYRQAFAIDPNIFQRTASLGIGEGVPTLQRAMMNYSLAKTYAEVGMNDRALQYLRLALQQGFKDRKKLMSDKEFALLRETPEFREMLTEHGVK
jgi:tetratricopeptide (TPR) repeat protein